jgi:hypothetical protein
MQEPTEVDEAPIPPEIVSSGSATNTTTVRLRRRAANRTEPLYLRRGTRKRRPPGYFASSPPPPQDEDNPAARKKPRLEGPLPTIRAIARDEAARKTDSHDVSEGHSPPANNNDDLNADAVTDTQPNARASTRATGRLWTLEEDAKLTSAVANTSKKKYGKEYKTDWAAIAALVLGRTRRQCWRRWQDVLDPSIDRTPPERTGNWRPDEDSKLKEAVKIHGSKNWGAVAALVPGRTTKQCHSRWNYVLDPSIDRANGCRSKWTTDEDSKLRDAVQRHGGKNWKTIAALVPGRTHKQCCNRWYHYVNQSIDRASRHPGKWTEYEDSMLRDAVQRHGGNHSGNHWGAIAALVPGQTKKQCQNRWRSIAD